MMVESIYTASLCNLLPVLSIGAGHCEDPVCGHIHGWQIEAGWLWWSILITWGVEE